MLYQRTTALAKITGLKKRIKIVQGGTSASKTISILQYLIDKAQQREGIVISVVSESMPHLKLGAMRDFLNIMKGHKYFVEDRWNKSDFTYTFETGSIIEFFSADSGKATGPRRNVLFLNECNNVPYQVFDDLELRTDEEVLLDYNPVGEFWVHTEVMKHHDYDFVKLTYRDNEGLPSTIKRTIEARKHKTNWWRIYGEGETGIKEGQVYQDWRPIAEIPPDAEVERLWCDFGFTNDPTAIGIVWRWRGAFILQEVDYRTGLKNRAIHNKIQATIEELKQEMRKRWTAEGVNQDEIEKRLRYFNPLTIADSSEPKSIKEIADYGTNITGAEKGQGSINYGIGLVQDEEVYVLETSLNIWTEQRNYLWKIDKKTNKPLNVPEEDFNHHMDGARYAITDILDNKKASLKRRISI